MSPTVRATLLVCLAGALLAAAAGLLLGRPDAGLAVSAGLLLGSLNGVLAQRALGHDMPFHATSLGRLGALSVAGLAIGFLAFPHAIPLVIAGLALAQLTLAGMALKTAVRR